MTAPFTQRWLVISHAFNMDGRAASQTITDKLPHLREAGIEVVVISGVSGQPDDVVEHHQVWPAGPSGIRFELRHVLRKRWGQGAMYRTLMLLATLLLLPGMLVEKLLRRVESSWSWWWSAYRVGRRLCAHSKFDLIYSTGGAFAAHVVASRLKKSTGLPWLAEVHDPLVTPGREGAADLSDQEKMQAQVERLICNEADIAIWFTEQALASASRRHPQLGNRGRVLLPGIDPPRLPLPAQVRGKEMVIGHFGSLSSSRHLGPIIAALETLLRQRPELGSFLRLDLYGGPLDPVSASLLGASSIRALVRHHGRIEQDPVTGLSGRDQILQRMRASDVLLLLHGEDAICSEYIPSKVYEYLWMQRPVVAVVHANPQLVDMLEGLGQTCVLSAAEDGNPQRESTQLCRVMAQHADQWMAGGLPDNQSVSPYTTAAAVRRLRTYVDECLALRKANPPQSSDI